MTSQPPEIVNSPNHNVDGDTVTVDLYDANKGKTPRTGGPYLDEIEREEAEKRRAKMENREPDLENPPAATGTVLVPKSQLVERDTDKSHYSDSLDVVNEPVASYEANVHSAYDDDPDPKQADWDNDVDKVRALAASNELDAQVEKKNTPDPEPSYEEI